MGGGTMTRKENIGGMTAIGGMAAAVLLLTGLPTAKADELADLRANQQLLQQRIDQLAQASAARAGQPLWAGAAEPGGNRRGDRRQLPALVSDPRHRHLDPGRRRNPRGPRLLVPGRPTNGTQNTTVGDNGNALSQPLDVHGQTVPGFPVAAKPGVGPANAVPVQVNHSRGNGIFQQSPRESKLNVETRTPTAYGEARTFMEFDWAGSNNFSSNQLLSVSDNLMPRLRYAYGTLGGLSRRPGQLELLRLGRQP